MTKLAGFFVTALAALIVGMAVGPIQIEIKRPDAGGVTATAETDFGPGPRPVPVENGVNPAFRQRNQKPGELDVRTTRINVAKQDLQARRKTEAAVKLLGGRIEKQNDVWEIAWDDPVVGEAGFARGSNETLLREPIQSTIERKRQEAIDKTDEILERYIKSKEMPKSDLMRFLEESRSDGDRTAPKTDEPIEPQSNGPTVPESELAKSIRETQNKRQQYKDLKEVHELLRELGKKTGLPHDHPFDEDFFADPSTGDEGNQSDGENNADDGNHPTQANDNPEDDAREDGDQGEKPSDADDRQNEDETDSRPPSDQNSEDMGDDLLTLDEFNKSVKEIVNPINETQEGKDRKQADGDPKTVRLGFDDDQPKRKKTPQEKLVDSVKNAKPSVNFNFENPIPSGSTPTNRNRIPQDNRPNDTSMNPVDTAPRSRPNSGGPRWNGPRYSNAYKTWRPPARKRPTAPPQSKPISPTNTTRPTGSTPSLDYNPNLSPLENMERKKIHASGPAPDTTPIEKLLRDPAKSSPTNTPSAPRIGYDDSRPKAANVKPEKGVRMPLNLDQKSIRRETKRSNRRSRLLGST